MLDIAEDRAVAPRRPGRPTLSNEDLLDKALDLFLEKGFAGTSIDAIAAAAGMAKRTLYARYGDKENLFRAALSRAIEDWIVPVERLRAAESDDPEASLLRIGTLLVANILRPEGLRLLRLSNAESVRMPEISSENVQRGTEPTLAYLADMFNRRFGLDEEAREAANAFLSIVVGGPASNAAWGMRVDPEAVERQTRYSVRLFLHGLFDREPTVATPTQAIARSLARARDDLDRARAALAQANEMIAAGQSNAGS